MLGAVQRRMSAMIAEGAVEQGEDVWMRASPEKKKEGWLLYALQTILSLHLLVHNATKTRRRLKTLLRPSRMCLAAAAYG